MNPIDPESQAAFVLKGDDRFHLIASSGDILLASEPGSVSVITVFVIHRTSGLFDIVILHKTFKDDEVKRTVMNKDGLDAARIDHEIEATLTGFADGVRAQTSHVIHWNRLDLRDATDFQEQVRRIKDWGGLKVTKAVQE